MRHDMWMDRTKFAIRWLLITVVVLFFLTLGTLIWALYYPGKAFALAQKYFLPADLTVKWEEMHFAAKKSRWRHWEINWSTKNLTVEKRSPELLFPVTEASVGFTLRIFEDGPWFSFHEIKAAAGEKAYFKSTGDDRAEKGDQSPYQQLHTYLDQFRRASAWLTVDKIEIRLPQFTILNPTGEHQTKFSLKLDKPSKIGGALGIEFSVAAGTNKVLASGWLDTAHIQGPEPLLHMEAEGSGAQWTFKAKLDGYFQDELARIDGLAEVIASERKIKAKPKFQILIGEREGLLKVETPVLDIPGPLVKLDKVMLELRQPFDNGYAWSERPAVFKIRTPVDLFFVDKDMRPPLEKSCRCKIPEKLTLTYEGRAWFEPMLGRPDRATTVLESQLSMEGVDNRLLNLDIKAHLKILKNIDQWVLDPSLDTVASVQSFQGLRQFLDAKNVMIPAPLDVLDGKITLSAKGKVDHDDKLIRATADVKVDLSSATQKVDVQTMLRFDLARDLSALDIFVQTLINNVKLEMPPIDPIRGMPSLKTDSRLVFKPAKAAPASKFKLRVFFDVKTASPGSLKLLSKLAVPYAPLTLDINNNSKGESAGSVRLEPFTLQYLRRKVNVERLQVTLNENEEGEFPLGGRLRLDQTAYKIYVDLAGTVDAPIVNFNSEPYLERADIISVLLYDRTSDQLVSADADTAGSVNAAMADRAIGLFGLWAFATTPIRSFSYNAVTKVYTATVQLADGLTAGVGTNWERAAHLEVRKRVSRRWVLTASWSPTENKEQVGKLVLQWEKRF